MRKLILATSVALTGAALAVPGGASADTADASVTPCTPLVPCLVTTVDHLVQCVPAGCLPPPCDILKDTKLC